MKISRVPAVGIAMVVLLVGVASPVFAHHSQAMFDINKEVTYQGTLTEVDWSNPHAYIYVDVKKEGAENAPVEKWAVEMPGPTALTRLGWTQDMSKAGDKISITGNPRKDGVTTMLLTAVTLANGKTFVMPRNEFLHPPKQ